MGLKRLIWFHREKEYPEVPDDVQLIRSRGGNTCIGLICSSPVVYGIIILILAIAVPLVVYVTVFANNPNFLSAVWRCDLKISYRVQCMKGISNIDRTRCENYGCCWNETDSACYHSLPSRHSYSVDNWTDASSAVDRIHRANLQLSSVAAATPYGSEAAGSLTAAAIPVTETHLRIFLWNTTGDSPTLPEGIDITTSRFKAEVYGPDYFSFEIVRRDDGATLLTTSRGPTIASIDYWELAVQFPIDGKVFGLGELHLTSGSKVMYNNAERLGANPFVMALDADGRAHGVLFNNPGPMEFEFSADSNILIVRSLSTMYWDFSVFAGPTPADVMNQYTSERRPVLPPKWALGLHICRETNNETAALDNLNDFMTGAKELGLPYESDCLQDRFLGDLNFTIPDYVTPLIEAFQDSGKKILVSLQPQVQPSVATQQDLFVLDEDGSVLEDDYQGVAVSFPDVFRAETGEWLKGNLQGLQLGSNLGGYVLIDEWPSVSIPESSDVERMNYVPDGSLSAGTLWWLVRHGETSHYLRHNEYALHFAEQVSSSLNNQEQIVLSSATYIGSGAVGGSHSHEVNEVPCTWSNMMAVQKTALGHGLAGISLAGGGPVCGNTGDYDDELCLRWYLMSSMLPLMRVSSEHPLRDPVNLNAFRAIVKDVVINRYSLLAYMYSLFLEAHSSGVPVARPMFLEFPSDSYTWLRSDHFMLGPALLVRPVFVPGGVSVQVYLPQEDVPWYHFHGGHQINNGTGGYEVLVPSLATDLVVLLRGGYIVASQDPTLQGDSITVEGTLATKYSLTVGMNCTNGSNCMAVGSLQVGLDSSWTAVADDTGLEVEGTCGSTSIPHIDDVLIYGMNLTEVQSVQVSVDPAKCSGTPATAEIQEQDSVLRFSTLDVDLCCGEPVRIAWTLS